MKRILAQILVGCLLSVYSFAQQQNKFELVVSLENPLLTTTKADIPVKVKITNNSAQVLDTEKLPGVLFKFSKCHHKEKCSEPKNVYVGGSDLKPKLLKKDASLEFTVNLAYLSWNDANAPVLDFSELGTLAKIPAGEYFFYAEIRIFDKVAKPNENPRYTSFWSNELEVKINPKGFGDENPSHAAPLF